ncbi:MAG: PQQ-dependent sugar dehydrogenase, partial [Thermoleophilia bacterium]|nr:PQQ-dependent sugar dehydrogenase [Thermoleophilia bacterium]
MRLLAALSALAAFLVLSAGAGMAERLGGRSASSTSTFGLAVVARGLEAPVGIATTPSEPRRLYVVEQRGTVRVIERGRLRSGFFLDVRDRVVSGGEQGLLGLAFDPLYPRNRFVYVNFTDREGHTRIVRFRTNGRRALPGSARLLLRV